MRELLLSIASPDSLGWIGFLMLAGGLLGEVGVYVLPPTWKALHGILVFAFAALVLAGFLISHIGDDEAFRIVSGRAVNAESALAKLKTPRTLVSERQDFVARATKPFAGQRYRASVSQGADDGVVFWESLYVALDRAGWVYFPAPNIAVGNPPAGIPIAAIPGVEIRLDPAKREELSPAALALGNALHADGMAVAVNMERQSNPDEAERDILNIVIGARVPLP